MYTVLFQVNWSESGDAIFHPGCWNKLVRAAKNKQSGARPDADDLQLNELETSLVVEAKKHAEFHNSMPEVKAEAARIAQMIKNAKYCIAFTGTLMI